MAEGSLRIWQALGVAGAAAALLAVGPAQAETRIALVIGNANYLHAAHLANPSNDADLIATKLRHANFSVDERKNLTHDKMVSAILAFSERAEKADVAVVYYAGHGVQRDGIDYLLPIDAALKTPASLPLEGVQADSVLSTVAQAHRLRLMILDACRDNPFGNGTRGTSHGLVAISAPSDTVTAYSAKENTVALDGGRGPNSPYAAALARHLDEPGVELDQMFREVRDDVIADTHGSQEPYVYDSRGRGNFYFMPGSAPVIKAVVQAAQAAPGVDSKTIEVEMWRSVETSNDPVQYQVYLKHYPAGDFADVARAKIAASQKSLDVASAKSDTGKIGK
jgi:uncharacterized caspase-like protein